MLIVQVFLFYDIIENIPILFSFLILRDEIRPGH